MDYELEPVDKAGEEPTAIQVGGAGEPQRDYILPVSILIAGLMISGSILYAVNPKNSANTAGGGKNQLADVGASAGLDFLKLTPRDVVLGEAKAPVTFIEYGDYQCPFCGRFFSQVEPQLRENYIKTGKVKMVFRNLQFLGPESVSAAAAAECARDQNKFWEYHDALYVAEIKDGSENNGNLKQDLFIRLADNLKLDAKAFASCIDSNKYEKQIAQDTSNAQAAGINSTPTSFVNGQKIQGALPYAQFASVIDSALNGK